MYLTCPQCKRKMVKEVSDYHYKESGLDNVYIKDTNTYHCNCGHLLPSFFRIKRLNELIALSLLEKTALLSGQEIRYLRKNLYMSAKDFAKKLKIGKTTLSKWENEKQSQSEINDRYIRKFYMIYKNLPNKEAVRILEDLSSINLSKRSYDLMLIAQRVNDDYWVSWSPIICAISGKTTSNIDTAHTSKKPLAEKELGQVIYLQDHTNVRFASSETLSTKTDKFQPAKEG